MKNALIILALFLASCKPQTVLTEHYRSDTTIVRETIKEVPIQGFKIESPKINIDSLATLIRSGVKPEIIRIQDPKNLAEINLIVDELGRLQATCEMQERVIEVLVEERERIITEFKNQIQRERRNILDTLRDWLVVFGIVLVLAIVIAIVKR